MNKLILRIGNLLRNAIWKRFKAITIGVRVIAVLDGKVMLIRHAYRDGWYLPGGGLLSGETLESAARRELHEETGIVVGELALFGVYTDFLEGRSDHKIVFLGEIIHQDNVSSQEIQEIKYFSIHNLPEELSIECRNRIQEYSLGNYPKFGIW